MDDVLLQVIFENLTREEVAHLLKLTKDLGHERLVTVKRSEKSGMGNIDHSLDDLYKEAIAEVPHIENPVSGDTLKQSENDSVSKLKTPNESEFEGR